MIRNTQESNKERRFEYDWLRVVAVLLLVPLHSALIFSYRLSDIVYIKNDVSSVVLMNGTYMLQQFYMPLLFFIAGGSAGFALDFRDGTHFVIERMRRLFMPLVFALIVLIPPMLYIQFLWKPECLNLYSSFFQYYPDFFMLTDDFSGYSGNFTPAHLWFILYLLIFSVLLLPVFVFLKRDREALGALRALFKGKGMLIVPTVLLLATEALPCIPCAAGKNPVFYLLVFFLGYLLLSDKSFREEVKKQSRFLLSLALLLTPILVLWFGPFLESRHLSKFSFMSILYGITSVFSTWCWLAGLVGLSVNYFCKNSKVLQYLSEISYPFYILHFPINTIVGYYIVQMDESVLVKYFTINIITYILTFVVLEFLVKRLKILQLLLGMKTVYRPQVNI